MNSSKEKCTVGVDIGATNTKIALVNNVGLTLAFKKFSTKGKGFRRVVNETVNTISTCLEASKNFAKAVGVGVAGQTDSSGNILDTPNIGWKNKNVKKIFEKRMGIPTIVTNDVRAATWGEWCHGSGRNSDVMVALFIGTGIGGGIVTEGKILVGHNNTAGELGHMTIVTGGRKCHCQNRGCLEAYASGWAIAQRAQEAVIEDPASGKYLLSIVRNISDITAKSVRNAYERGDELAKRLVEETGKYLGSAVVNIINVLNPNLLILGGSVIDGIPDMVEIAEKLARKYALRPALVDFSVKRASLGEYAGAIGAASIAQINVV